MKPVPQSRILQKKDLLKATGITDYRTLSKFLRRNTELWEALQKAKYEETSSYYLSIEVCEVLRRFKIVE